MECESPELDTLLIVDRLLIRKRRKDKELFLAVNIFFRFLFLRGNKMITNERANDITLRNLAFY